MASELLYARGLDPANTHCADSHSLGTHDEANSTKVAPFLPLPTTTSESSRTVTRSSLVQELETGSEPCRQWLVLLAFCMNTALNAFLSVNFSVVSEKTRGVLHADKSQVALLYTGFLLTVAIGMLPGLALVTNCEAVALGLGVLANVASAWVRWIGVRRRSYNIAFVSAVFNAAGAWIILPMPAQLSQQRFPSKWWTLTTSIAVQANYTGWLFGSILPPALVTDAESMERFMFYQALCSLLVIVGYVLFYRPVPPEQRLAGHHTRSTLGHSILSSRGEPVVVVFDQCDTSYASGRRERGSYESEQSSKSESHLNQGSLERPAGGGHADGSMEQFCRTLRRYPQFGMQVLAYGILGGVSFAVPGCDDELLQSHGFKPTTVSLVNTAFLATGIISGLLLGAKCTARSYRIVLKTLFLVSALGFTALAIVVCSGALPKQTHAQLRSVVIVSCLFGLVGMSSLGFIGLGIEAAALYPAGGAYVCFTIEGLVQVVGAVLNYACVGAGDFGFVIIAICAWVAALLVFCGYDCFTGSADTTGTLPTNPHANSTHSSASSAEA